MSLITCVICIQSRIPTSNSRVEIKVSVYTEPRIVKDKFKSFILTLLRFEINIFALIDSVAVSVDKL